MFCFDFEEVVKVVKNYFGSFLRKMVLSFFRFCLGLVWFDLYMCGVSYYFGLFDFISL